MKYKGKFGSICKAENGDEAVLVALLDEFVRLSETYVCIDCKEVVRRMKRRTKNKLYVESGDCYYDINELCKIHLQRCAPQYCYYGLNDGEYGLWPDMREIKKDIQSGVLKMIKESDEVGRKYIGVNEDGKISMYRVKNVEYEEVW